MIAGERLRDLFQGEGDDFSEMGLNVMKGGPTIFKSCFVSSLPQAVENCDEDGSHEFRAIGVNVFGEGVPDC